MAKPFKNLRRRMSPDSRRMSDDILDDLLKGLDVPDPSIDAIWLEEAKRRLAAYRAGRIGAVPFEEVFKDE